jgi:hypothetical protein
LVRTDRGRGGRGRRGRVFHGLCVIKSVNAAASVHTPRMLFGRAPIAYSSRKFCWTCMPKSLSVE